MKKIVLAVLTVLSLGAAAANAQSLTHGWDRAAGSYNGPTTAGN